MRSSSLTSSVTPTRRSSKRRTVQFASGRFAASGRLTLMKRHSGNASTHSTRRSRDDGGGGAERRPATLSPSTSRLGMLSTPAPAGVLSVTGAGADSGGYDGAASTGLSPRERLLLTTPAATPGATPEATPGAASARSATLAPLRSSLRSPDVGICPAPAQPALPPPPPPVQVNTPDSRAGTTPGLETRYGGGGGDGLQRETSISEQALGWMHATAAKIGLRELP